MSSTTLDATARPAPGAALRPAPLADPPRAPRRRPRPLPLAAWVAAAALVALSALLVVWARTRPGFDPYGWLTWGRMTWAGDLDTNAAPSWKPLPYLFTLPYGLLGAHGLRLWMVTALAGGLAGCGFAARLAIRLTDAPDRRRWAGWVAAAIAAAALLALRDQSGYGYAHYLLSAQSDPMIAACVLAAIDLHLSRRYRWAFLAAGLAALGRPEAWPFWLAYSAWGWRAQPRMRTLIAAGWVALLALWFGVPALSSRTPWVAAANAMDSGRAPSGDRVTGVLGRFVTIAPWPLSATALLGVALAAWRRDRLALVLAGGVLAWVAIEVAFGLHGWPALGRYMFEAAAVTVVLAAACAGRLLAGNWRPAAGARPVAGAGRWAPAALVAALGAGLIPFAVDAVRSERADLTAQHARTAEIKALPRAIARLGGAARLRSCGEPVTRLTYQSTLAYNLRDNVSQVGFRYAQSARHGNPVVFFTPVESGVGWVVQALHQVAPRCRSLPAAPGGRAPA